MAPDALSFPFEFRHRDTSGLFVIEATVVAWRDDRPERGRVVTLTIGTGTLHDADKGPFPLDGLELTLCVTIGRTDAMSVRNPGALSEVQQEALLDAIGSVLDAAGRPLPSPAQE